MDDARSRILARLRAAKRTEAPSVPLAGPWTTYDDPVLKFKEMVVAAGGEVVDAISHAGESVADVVRRQKIFREARRVDSFVDSIPTCERDDDPHSAADSDLGILKGEFGVAENGAIFVRDSGSRPRSSWFLCQHCIIVVDRREIVHHMHAAMERVSLDGCVFGLFVSGPSKTADIEQAMVIGAHGARSLVVVLT